jgi:potassium inwardly-rectifying channel subfamily J
MSSQQQLQQPVPIKVLQKTKGSKAMRIMGNNNAINLSSNEMLKSQISFDKASITSRASSAAFKKQQQKRLFFKNGNINISRSNINKRRRRYLTDIFTTLIDLKWRYNILVFAFGFVVSWLFFAACWYMISYLHGDLNNLDNKDYVGCIYGLKSFISAILFSIETQQTIGYGARYTTEKCPEAVLIMMIQSTVGVIIQSFMVGVVFVSIFLF